MKNLQLQSLNGFYCLKQINVKENKINIILKIFTKTKER